MNNLKILSWNLLAPCWAGAEFYKTNDPDVDSKITSIVDWKNRKGKLCKKILEFDCDVLLLQECQEPMLEELKDALNSAIPPSGREYISCGLRPHGDTYWREWDSPDTEHAPNGNAIFYRAGIFVEGTVKADGVPIVPPAAGQPILSVCATLDGEIAIRGSDGEVLTTTVRLRSVHLEPCSFGEFRDFDVFQNQVAHLRGLFPLNGSSAGHSTLDIVAGDFNICHDTPRVAELGTNPLVNHFNREDFKDAVKVALSLPQWGDTWEADERDGTMRPHYTALEGGRIDGVWFRGRGTGAWGCNKAVLLPDDEYSACVKGKDVGAIEMLGSDHLPVVINLNCS